MVRASGTAGWLVLAACIQSSCGSDLFGNSGPSEHRVVNNKPIADAGNSQPDSRLSHDGDVGGPSVGANPTILNVMSLNINAALLSEDLLLEKVNKIADHIIKYSIHIAGIQELRVLRANGNPSENRDVAMELQQALERKGYPMHLHVQSNSYQEGWFVNATFSVFPISPIREIKLTANRFAIVSQIQTSIGNLDFMNVHVHHKTMDDTQPYKDFKETIFQEYPNNPDLILVGDINNGQIYNEYYSDCTATPCYQEVDIIDFVGFPPIAPGSQYNYVVNTRIVDGALMDERARLTFDHPAVIATVSARSQ